MRLVAVIVLGFVAVSMIGTGVANAQGQPAPFPWERRTDKLLQPKKIDRTNRARRTLNRSIRKLRLPRNGKLQVRNPKALTAPAPDISRYDRLDRNRDGSISRGEYMNGRSRPARTGQRGYSARRSHRSRLNSRFRAADGNRDGRLSTKELQSIRNRRF